MVERGLQNNKGLSIIEVLVALFLVAILAIGIQPKFTSYLAQNRVKSVAEGLYSNFVAMRTNAMQTGTSTTVTFTTGTSWCYGMSSGAIACNCASAPSASNCNLGVVSVTNNPGTAFSTSLTTVSFDPVRGILTSLAGGSVNITATTGSQNLRVTINNFGTASICSAGNVGGYVGC